MVAPIRLLSSVFLAFAWTLSSPLAAAAPPPEAFTESIDVRVVNVEAVVTDRQGKRVRGLTPADFRLLVDGKEVPIDYFTEVVNGEALARQPAADTAGRASVPAPAAGTVGRSILLFVDLAFPIRAQLGLVLRRLEADFKRLGPQDRVAVVAFDGEKLAVLADWTGDREVLHAALALAAEAPTGGAALRAEAESLANDQDLADTAAFLAQEPAIDLKELPWLAASRLQKTVSAATASLRGFAAAPGRKVALLLSGGWPAKLQPQVFPRLIDTANRLGYSLYPVDVTAILTQPVPMPASMSGPLEAGKPSLAPIVAEGTRASLDALQKIAGLTGGKAAFGGSRLAALGTLLEDTEGYYWLGFSPTWRGDGRRHAVRLESRRSGLAVRSRRSFTDLSSAAESALAIEARLLLGRGVTERTLYVELGAPRRASLKQVDVPLILGIPAGALAFVAAGDTYRAEVPLHVTSFGAGADALDLPPVVLRAEVRQVPPAGELLRFQSVLRVSRGEKRLRFTVQDSIHDKLLWGEGEIAGVQPAAR